GRAHLCARRPPHALQRQPRIRTGSRLAAARQSPVHGLRRTLLVRSAMLFAAGLGTRLLPLTARTPKPLVQVGGKPLLDYGLERFLAYGCERIVINTHHLAEQVVEHVAALGLGSRIQLSHEPALLETGGGIVQALPWLGT